MTYVHIYAPKGEYIGQIRRYGHRRWEEVGKAKTAANAMVKERAIVKTANKIRSAHPTNKELV